MNPLAYIFMMFLDERMQGIKVGHDNDLTFFCSDDND